MTNFNGFIFSGPKLDDMDFPRVGALIGVGEDVVHAVIETETSSKSVDSKGRIIILFEPHVMYRCLPAAKRAAAVKAGVAYEKWGTKKYPADSYPVLIKAMAIDETAALQACSWGFPQVLGENFKLAGYDSVQDMVADFLKDEDNQLEGMVRFIKAAGGDDELRVIEKKLKAKQTITPDDCRAFVRIYNGKGYEKNGYHTKFAKNLNKWAKIPDTPYPGKTPSKAIAAAEAVIPDDDDLYSGKKNVTVETVQRRLDDLGYHEVGTVDGEWGGRTAGAITTFQADNGLELNPKIDAALLAALMTAKPRVIDAQRANATVADLRQAGDKEIKKADQSALMNYGLLGGGVLTGGVKGLNEVKGTSETLRSIWDTLEPVQTFILQNIWLLLGAAGAFGLWKVWQIQKERLEKHQTGKDVSL